MLQFNSQWQDEIDKKEIVWSQDKATLWHVR